MEKNVVQTLDRAFNIIELLSLQRDGLGVSEIGNRIDLHKSTVHRLLTSLCELGYIEKDEKTSLYKLGLKFIEVCSLRLNHLELKTEAAPYLRGLAEKMGQAVHLAILDKTEAVYIEKIEPVSTIRMYSQIGRRIPVHCTALGKSLLSGLPDDEISKTFTGVSFQNFTPNTKTGLDDLLRNVSKVRSAGWSIDDEEYEKNIRCIAAPVRDYARKIIAAISVSGDKKVMSETRDTEISGLVRSVAEIISKRMGYIS